MANNPYVNKVVFGSSTLVDLTGTTATADKILEGYGAFGADGAWMDGTATGSGSGAVWQDAQGYVHLSDEGDIELQTKTVSPTESAQTVLADAGYYALDRVNVNAIPSNYVGSGVTQRTSSDLTASGATVTAPSGYYASSASKSIPTANFYIGREGEFYSDGGALKYHSRGYVELDTSYGDSEGWIGEGSYYGNYTHFNAVPANTYITPSTSSQIIGGRNYVMQDAVTVTAMPSGTEGTPTATKGAVSNHAVTVTPSVTNTAGYITGSTKTGTAVSVSASELVSGTKSISANGTGIDVTNFASVDVAVSSSTPTLITKSITANGTYNASSDSADGYSSVTVNVSGGGGGEPAPKKQINFIDYDGTILHSYTKTEWQSVSTLPSNPSHSGLTAQGWNWTKAQIDAQLTSAPNGDVWVGQMYITTSGDTEIDVLFADSARLSPTLTIAVNGTVTVDWGDNTTPSTVTGTSLTTRQAPTHTYASVGEYTIAIHVVSGSFQFYGSSTYLLLRKNTTGGENRVYSNCVQAVRLGSGVTSIGNYAFYNCYSLASITLPSGVTSIGTNVFTYCYSLASITLPSGVTSIGDSVFYACNSLANITIPSNVTSIGNYAFYSCYSLASITLPSGVTSIGASAFSYCYSLASITLPSGVTSIGDSVFNSCYSLASITLPSDATSIGINAFTNCHSLASITIPSDVTSIGASAFSNCHSLASITIPSDVTSIGASAFSNCYGMAECHILPTTPPTLGSTNVFTNIVSDCVIYVPSASLSTYQTASNWSTYASYMQGE